MTLTIKQEAYARARVAGANQHDAYVASYDASRMLPNTIDRRALELEGHGAIAARIAELLDVTHAAHAVAADRLTGELAAVAFANIYDYVTIVDGEIQVRDTDELTVLQQHAVRKIKSTKRHLNDGTVVETIEFELSDRLKAIELLSRRFPEFSTKLEHSGEVTHQLLFEAAVGNFDEDRWERIARGILAMKPKETIDV